MVRQGEWLKERSFPVAEQQGDEAREGVVVKVFYPYYIIIRRKGEVALNLSLIERGVDYLMREHMAARGAEACRSHPSAAASSRPSAWRGS